MRHIAIHARKEASHDIQIREVVHQLARLRVVVVVPGDLYDARHIVVAILVIRGCPDALEQIVKVLVRNRKLLQQPVGLEQFKPKVDQGRLLQNLRISENVKVPLVKVVHQLDQVSPHPRVQVNDLA